MLGLTTLIGQNNSGGGAAGLLIPLVLMGAVFYFLLIRPQQRRQRQQRELLSNIEVGDDVLTIGGMYGTIRAVDDDELTVEIAEGVDVRMLKSAIARRLTVDDYEDDEVDATEEAGEQS